MAGTDRQTQTTRSTMDPATQEYFLRNRTALGGYGANLGFGAQTGAADIGAYLNPYLQSVIDPMRAEYARQRAIGQNTAADMATRAGAFGGGREAVLRAMALRDVNQAEAGGIGNLLMGGWNSALEAMLNERARVGNLGLGMAGLARDFASPLEQTNTQTLEMKRALLPQLLGMGLAVGSRFIPGAGPAMGAAGAFAPQYDQPTLSAPYIGGTFARPPRFGNLGFGSEVPPIGGNLRWPAFGTLGGTY